jgi:hypothetical protein
VNSIATVTAAVVRPQLTWFSAAGRGTNFHATPPWAVHHLDRLVLAAQTLWMRNREEGTVLWQCDVAPAALAPMLTAMLDGLRNRGCRVSDAGRQTGWFSIWHAGYPTIHLGIGPLIKQGRTTFGRLDEAGTELAEKMARYADLTGAAWRGTGGLSGTAAIRSIHEATRGGVPLWVWKHGGKHDGVGSSFELMPSRTTRALTEDELGRRWMHHFDIRAQYLAAAGLVMVGWSQPEQTGPREFDPGRAGYWRVNRAELDAITLPIRRDLVYRQEDTDQLSITTPVMVYLAEHGGTPPYVIDSLTCERSGRYLRPWADRLTAARKTLSMNIGHPIDAGVLAAVKDTYARTSGMLNRDTSRIARADWYDAWRDHARINLCRKVENAGVSPVRFNVDSIWVASDEDAYAVGRKLGIPYLDGKEVDQVGKFKHVASYTIAEYLAQYRQPVAV